MDIMHSARRSPFITQLTIWGPSTNIVTLTLDKDEVSVGRAAGNDVVLSDDSISRRHLCIRRTPTGFTVEDMGSRHGATLNGEPLHGRVPLASGSRIVVGNTNLLFEEIAPQADDDTRSRQEGFWDDGPAFVGRSHAMTRIRDVIARAAGTSSPILILGESGTGKEIVARLLHSQSPRRDHPFIVVNCPALPGNLIEAELFGIEKNVATGVSARPGKLEEANGGTVFLDELGDLAPEAQAKLLRFLADRKIERVGGRKPFEVDVRVVAATHHDLAADVAAGRFRLDLYYRLNTIIVQIPPLRDRREDIPLLVEHFLVRQSRPRRSVAAAAMDVLCRYSFPGNVRELEAIVTRAAILHDELVLGADAFGLSLDTPAPASNGIPNDEDTAARLLQSIDAGESFWTVVHGPFLRRALSAEAVRGLIGSAYVDSGSSYRKMAARLGIISFKEYKKFADFLRNHDLRPRDS